MENTGEAGITKPNDEFTHYCVECRRGAKSTDAREYCPHCEAVGSFIPKNYKAKSETL